MGKLYPIQNNFTAGELSPQLLGRTDIAKYYNGAKILKNLVVRAHGGVSKFPGSHFVNHSRGNAYARLIPFQFSVTQAYILEFTNLKIRVYKDNGTIVDSVTVTNGTFDSDVTTGWTDLSAGTGSISHDAANLRLELNGVDAANYGYNEQAITTIAGVDYDLKFDTFDNDIEVRVGTGTGLADIANPTVTPSTGQTVIFTASGTTTYIGFKNAAAVTAGVDNVTVENGFYQIATTYVEADIDDLQVVQSADVMWIVHPSYKPRKLTRTGHTAWTLTSWAPTADPFTSADNYPAAVTFYQQRIIFGATNSNPSGIWASKNSGDYEDMTVGVNDSDGYQYTITSGSGRVPVIRWLAGADDLLIGCAGMVARATGGNLNPITPTNIDVREQSTKGCKNRQPIVMDGNAIFIQRSGRKIRDLGYDLARNGYQASNIILLSEHLGSGGIQHLAYQDEPNAIMWGVRDDGVLIGLTYEKEEQVAAWQRYMPPGTDAKIESVAIIPMATGDQLWMSISRTINGSTVRHIVYVDDEIWRESLNSDSTETEIKAAMPDCFYVDSGLTYDGSVTTTITGLSHLIGEEVSILADGAVHPRKTVSSGGSITLNYSASKVHVGLPYKSTLITLPLGDGGQYGAPLGRKMKWSTIRARLYLSAGGSINGEEFEYIDTEDALDSPAELFTGIFSVNDLGWDNEGIVNIEQDLPLPFTVLNIGGELELSE